MSTIQNVTDPNIVKYAFSAIVGLIGFINVLGFFILKGIKKSIDELFKRQRSDHDLLKSLKTEHVIFHENSKINNR